MPLESFHPACQNWFRASFGEPTPAQAQAWPAIQAGRHTLISAPTGSGKTLAAFYAAIDEMLQKGIRNQLEDGVHILYVSPLKALSNDIHRNLEMPLDGIAEHMHLLGQAPVDIRVAVRTGDTPANERQKMAKNPPHILVTTPESLYLLLTSASGRAMLANVSTLIVDEIHAMLGDKRGAHLALSIERLEHLVRSNSGQHLRRVGLSATQKPIDMVARYLVSHGNTDGDRVDCEIVDSGFRRKLQLHLEVPGSPLTALMSNEVWEELYERLLQLIQQHETTLIFVNTRRLSERLALALTDRLGDGSVCSHHGSMSKDHRHNAEQRLKAGQLKVLVATASMELGIDVGSVDLVVQISSPKSIATFLQRVGRSGHSVKGTPKGILFPLTRDDLIESAALLHSIHNGELDRIIMPEKPLDILAQQIVAEVSSLSLGKGELDDGEGWDLDALYALFSNAWPYRNLSRAEFDRIIKMLSEGYTSRRGRRGTHLHLDLINNKVRSRRGANLVSLTNGGAIPDMFDYQVVLDPEDVVVGTLNEDFALEALPGDVFTLGTHAWQMLRVDGLKVRVRDAEGMSPTIPFWFGEGPGRTQELSQSVSRLRETIGELLINESAGAAMNWLIDTLGLPSSAAQQMVEYLQAGMSALGVMPTRETLVMERFFDEVGDMHVVIHSPYGSRLNRAWGLALRKRFCKSFNFELQAAANEDSIVISLGSVHSFALDEVYRYLQTSTVRDTLIQAMLDAPMFEVRWRWNATRSLAIQRNRNGKRVPPQFQRMDAEDLVAHVFPDQIACQENITGRREVPDHPLVNQTVDDCLTEAMDIDELESLISNIENDRLTLIAKDLREPSPFAQEIINARPYAFLDDAPFEERRTNAIRNRSWADPADARDYSQLDAEAIARVKEEAWPFISNPEELHDALLSATYITDQEYTERELSRFSENLLSSNRITQIAVHERTLWVATENLPRFIGVFKEQLGTIQLPAFLQNEAWQPEEAMREIVRGRLQCLGPITAGRLSQELGLEKSRIDQALIALEVEGFAFQGHFTPMQHGAPEKVPELEWCERTLLQRIHRYTIDQHRKAIKPVSLETYTEFLFDRHQLVPLRDPQLGIAREEQLPALDGQTQLQNCLQMLDGISAPAVSWEADIYPTRIADYDPNWLDVMCISGKLAWGRYSQPQKSIRKMNPKRNAGPVKSTPITLLRRSNLDIWKALARSQVPEEQQVDLSGSASKIADDLQNNGASFYDEIQRRTGLLRTQMEEGLAELVAQGQLSSDSFTGLRALLTPNHKKPGSHRRRGRSSMFGVEDAGRWSLLDTFQASAVAPTAASRHWQVLDEEQLERLITVYLHRWGVLFRGILDKEMAAPPWRILLARLRRMELQGILRGGRFIAGVGGEQFAFAETVDELRKFKRGKEAGAGQSRSEYFCVAATDPVNLINFILPGRKLPRLSRNRVLYRGGVPIAVMESGEVHYLKQATAEEQWQWQQMLMKRVYPPRLRNYLGTH
ncbi:MAG: DEAD/DEAH box helicase [Proteobacteria bacterium]|nr:DEAD/DEAH box helicase [Pseudomonadota bacterium]MDA0927291.1 DEAD/DEAH box helicase [Pseudomonadota bacterium]